MDAVTASALRRPASGTETGPSRLVVKATYTLSEDGRKASLLVGGNGRAEQVLDLDVPANRLHLVTVDAEGNARLKLRPRYETRPDGRVVKNDAAPTYDRPPSMEELFLAAARNHELERAYVAQRAHHGRDAEERRACRMQLAEAFLSAPEQRALAHPPPSAKLCYLMGPKGRILFDAERDEPPAGHVPPEAHRRFRADERARRERNMLEHARRLAVHEDKKRFITDWIAANGTPEQQERQAAGVLPIDEALETLADAAFAPLHHWPRYIRNGPEVLQAHLRRHPAYEHATVTSEDLAVRDADAESATAEQWARVQDARAILPDATVTLRAHRLTWRRDPRAPGITRHGLLVARTAGPFVLRREFAVLDTAIGE